MKIEKGLYTYNFDYLMHKWIFEALEPHFRDGKTLEIGCFQGRMSSILFNRFQNLFIVEPEIQNIEIAATVVPEAVFNNCKIEDYVTSIRFQNIFLMHTLEHIKDDVNALTMIRSLLDEKGRLYIVVPNANAASRQIAVAGGIIYSKKGVTDSEREHGHYRTYDLVDLKQSVHTSGLKTIAEGGVFFKGLANFQLDLAIESGIIGPEYLEGCVVLGKILPDLCSSIYVVCERV